MNAPESAQFDFFQQWYPIAPIEDVPDRQPYRVTLVGRPIVVWKSPEQGFVAFLDICPHRLAPLSEGRIDEKTGNLMCSYHGWQFDAKGKCQRIPQSDRNPPNEKNSQFCATVLPVQEGQGLLWIWPDEPSSHLASDRPLPLSPQCDREGGFVWKSMVRDLEYDWSTLVENLVDPSHVPFAHHGIQGNRDRATPLAIEILISTPDLIEAKSEGRLPSQITFEPPCRLEYALKLGENRQLGLVTYCIPRQPGQSRIVAQFPRNFAKRLHRLTPRWFNHIRERNAVLDSDMVLLHYQERYLHSRHAGQTWSSAYVMPTRADRLVIEFRRWFDRYCEGKLPWTLEQIQAFDPRPRPREVLLDRYTQHTQLCQSCRGALKAIQYLEIILIIAAIGSILGLVALPNVAGLFWRLSLIFVCISSLGGWSWLHYRLKPRFYFKDYIHSEH
ncbi:MAG: Rieske 2Fe-2S domain-containing protein [Cyanobacteria bacterium SBLK]|nr:Rieske 2Fe-2S domain-containing protein [Cyanobacteria bacterium SBLK]